MSFFYLVTIAQNWLRWLLNPYGTNDINRQVIAIVLLLAFFWLLFKLIGRLAVLNWELKGDIGPILVEEFSDKPGLAALLRQYLHTCGAKCSNPANISAPSLTPGFDEIKAIMTGLASPGTTLAETLLALAGYISQFFGFKKTGYNVTCVLAGDEKNPPLNIYIEIKLTHNGNLEKSYSLSGNSQQELIKRAAYWIFWYISGQKRVLRNIPPWVRFPTFESFWNYREATETNAQDFARANKLYGEAAKEAPFNALVRLGWGDLNELKDQYVDALAIYLEAALMWPHLYSFWYRIAAVFSCSTEWCSEDERSNGKSKQTIELIRVLFNRFLLLQDDPLEKAIEKDNFQVDMSSARVFLELSHRIWKFIEGEVKKIFVLWLGQIWKDLFLIIFSRTRHQPGLVRYYWNMIPFFGWQNGVQFLRTVQIAGYCTRVQMGADEKDGKEVVSKPDKNRWDKIQKRVEEIVKKPWNTMEVYYDAACFYAQLFKSTQNAPYLSNAKEYLKIACKDPGTRPCLDWIQNDPDLTPLKEDPEFMALFDYPAEKESASNEVEKKKNLLVLKIILAVAKHLAENGTILPGGSWSDTELIAAAEYQLDLWSSLSKLLESPADTALQKTFWRLVHQNDKPADKLFSDWEKNELYLLEPAAEPSPQEIGSVINSIKDLAQAQTFAWTSHLEDSKLFLQHGDDTPGDRVVTLWRQAETWAWDSISQEIGGLFNPPKNDSPE